MTRSALALVLAISACGHGETPPPSCGDRIIQFGEQCDDGNDNPNDGCDQCVAMNCGNGRLDEFEICDDGNLEPGDGCGADCQLEQTVGFGLVWSFVAFETGRTSCPDGFPTIEFTAIGERTGTRIETFDCVVGAATLQLARDRYLLGIRSTSVDGVPFGRSFPQPVVDLRFTGGTLNLSIVTDEAFVDFAWELVGAVTGNPLTCAEADVSAIELTTQLGLSSTFACEAGAGTSGFLKPGSYAFTATARDVTNQSVGASAPVDGTISIPIVLTDLGAIEIPIPGL